MKASVFKLNALATTLASLLLAPTAFAEDEKNQTKSMDVITVHGEKIERSLKDTASSVSVIDAETLLSGQYLSVANAVGDVANVVALSGAVPDIRGVSGNGSATGFNSFTGGSKARVSTLIDGVAEPFVADLSGDTGLWDISQIEVFRGPQSTSNGRNSIAGSVFITTFEPTFEWDGAARVAYRDQSSYIDSAFMVSGPIMDDKLAFRLTGQNVDGETFKKEIVHADNPPPFDLNELKTNRLRGKVLWQPSGDDSLKVLFSYAYADEKGNAGRNYFTADDPWAFNPYSQRYMETGSDTASVKVDYQINSELSFDLLVAQMKYDWGFSSYEANAGRQQTVKMNDDSYTIDGKVNFGNATTTTQGFVGVALYQREQKFNSQGAWPYHGDDESKSMSLYGEVNYEINEKFNVIAGGRVEREEQLRDFHMLIGEAYVHDRLDNEKTFVLPKLVVQYAMSDETTISASARRGYNAGGGAMTRDNEYYYFDQEAVNTYELSVRSSQYDGDVNISANLFFNNFDGYQGSDLMRKISNIDDAQSTGLEVEVTAFVSDSLQLRTGLGVLDTEITDADPSFGDVKGNELNSAPKSNASIGAKYWVSDVFTVDVSTQYVDEYFGDYYNTPERVAGGFSTTRLNLDYQVDNWRVSGFVNNVFDKKGITVLEPAGRRAPLGYAAITDPRNMGVSVQYNF
ncbi:TonB-dependent receptor [Psychrobium sp. 1_MG-2023]|uniref:TonB-dependent receptor n=1 Tax=Psychrobium sp. 1_MG-2023 TaxID=3062624 RepID=UPI000C329276|nr:TonB-dependent receptor [Psychrobium sp. 1_MG-2023]MDP2562692.1 TonB-dependent receptor [Psychrobium sp. 1_MG-2023]PKF54795.1 TonB-dependent receptor [Alteromonadales bacterium alter-6D02]